MKSLNKYFLTLAFVSTPAFANIFTDAQITKIMETANAGELNAAQTAKSRAKSPEVQAFASKMANEHGANSKELKDLAKNQKIKPVASDKADQIATQLKMQLTQLKTVKDAEFDRAYIQTQIDAHQSLLQSIDNELLSNVKDPELKSYLEKTRSHVSNHLDEAKAVQAKL